jgi:hypothetical protein
VQQQRAATSFEKTVMIVLVTIFLVPGALLVAALLLYAILGTPVYLLRMALERHDRHRTRAFGDAGEKRRPK